MPCFLRVCVSLECFQTYCYFYCTAHIACHGFACVLMNLNGMLKIKSPNKNICVITSYSDKNVLHISIQLHEGRTSVFFVGEHVCPCFFSRQRGNLDAGTRQSLHDKDNEASFKGLFTPRPGHYPPSLAPEKELLFLGRGKQPSLGRGKPGQWRRRAC